MVQNKFHKSFKLNGISFNTVDEILRYTKDFSVDIHQFLENWFAAEHAILVQTSGSTGLPKSIQLKKELMQNSALATGAFFNLPKNTTALLCLPTQYIAGKMMLVRAITLGWHLDVVEPSSNPLEKIEKNYDFSAMVPLQLENSLLKIKKIKKLIVGGGVVSNLLQKKLQHLSTEVFATYGMTETITHIAVKKLNKPLSFIGRITKTSFETKVNSFYQTLPNVTIYKDQRNCLVISAPKVAEKLVVTNDVVQLISDTQFQWLGRFDNVINSGGVKLHPEKIEEKLSKIIENRFFVAGINDEKLGEKLILILEASPKNDILGKAEKSLLSKIQNLTSLSKFEKPKEIYFTSQFIETKTGKIQRTQTLQKIFTK
ncbi:AMP-binding protein [Polaribacter sp. R77954]|uniref:AMP-binding protein n=1 Tax=Polaribacter sp. R77954 TaxID=3093870 RepID=UPI0037C6C01A